MSNNEPEEGGWLGHNASGTSPLVAFVMAMTVGTLQILAGILFLVICTLLWVSHKPEGFVFAQGDVGILLVMVVLMFGSWFLALRIKRKWPKNEDGSHPHGASTRAGSEGE